jgi:hypothetical protein
MKILDLSNAAAPELVASYQTDGEIYTDIAQDENYLYLAGSYTITVLDPADPPAPGLVQYKPLPTRPRQIEIAGDYLYASCTNGFIVCSIAKGVCGDVNDDGIANISDALAILEYIFSGGSEPPGLDRADVDCDTILNISDVVFLVSFIFSSGPEPCDPDGDGIPDC